MSDISIHRKKGMIYALFCEWKHFIQMKKHGSTCYANACSIVRIDELGYNVCVLKEL